MHRLPTLQLRAPAALARPGAAAPRRAARAAAPRAATYTVDSPAAGRVVVEVLPDETSVASFLVDAVEAAAAEALAARGAFTLAIPGGSVMKALAGLAAPGRAPVVDWSRTPVFWVNHKCVPNDDAATSSLAKARALFLDALGATRSVAALGGSADAAVEAAAYEARLAAVAQIGMARAPSGAPRFDLVLLGVGADGHVGSLYPGGAAVNDTSGAWVLPVEKSKPPSSITLSLPVMNAGRKVIVCLTGAKKAAAAKLALETRVPAGEFPAQLVQPDFAPAVWVLDEAAAAELTILGGGGDAAPAPGQGRALADGSIMYTF
jgi:6-phosphogluconolactonase